MGLKTGFRFCRSLKLLLIEHTRTGHYLRERTVHNFRLVCTGCLSCRKWPSLLLFGKLRPSSVQRRKRYILRFVRFSPYLKVGFVPQHFHWRWNTQASISFTYTAFFDCIEAETDDRGTRRLFSRRAGSFLSGNSGKVSSSKKSLQINAQKPAGTHGRHAVASLPLCSKTFFILACFGTFWLDSGWQKVPFVSSVQIAKKTVNNNYFAAPFLTC